MFFRNLFVILLSVGSSISQGQIQQLCSLKPQPISPEQQRQRLINSINYMMNEYLLDIDGEVEKFQLDGFIRATPFFEQVIKEGLENTPSHENIEKALDSYVKILGTAFPDDHPPNLLSLINTI